MTTAGTQDAELPRCVALELEALPRGRDWLRVVGGLHERPGFFWLDSSRPGAPEGRYSFAGADPWAQLVARGGATELRVRRAPWPGLAPGVRHLFGDPLEIARQWLPRLTADAPPSLPFCGGWVGALGYELGSGFEGVPVAGGAPASTPELALLAVDHVHAHDHLEGRSFALALGFGEDEGAARADARSRLTAMRECPDGAPPPGPARHRGERGPATSGFDAESHAKAVFEIRDRIAAGDLYQACLTHRLELPFDGDPWALHATLRARNPAPFAALLELPGVTLVASSPERFLHVGRDGWAESRPIKGTRRRGDDPQRDAELREALRASDKDRAENLMIVDLVRNDLGRVCELGSVHVPGLFELEAHPTVHQMVSTVRGRLRPGLDAFDAVRATFPAGSMTGAPKIAAMDALAGIETVPRGLYAGAFGAFDAAGGCELAMTIRSAILVEGRALVHTGGGIVWDSVAAEEWDEADAKAAVIVDAVADEARRAS